MPTADNSFDNPSSHPERVIPDWSHGRPADGPAEIANRVHAALRQHLGWVPNGTWETILKAVEDDTQMG